MGRFSEPQLFTSEKQDWSTPQWLFDELDNEFHFTLDPCASPDNAKCENYYTVEDDGLSKNWGGRECSAIRHTTKLRSGLRNVTGKAARITQQ